MITFKSLPEYFYKERSGLKPNTVRIVDKDERFNKLFSGEVKVIKIVNSQNITQSFERFISDITFFDVNGTEVVIISWEQDGGQR